MLVGFSGGENIVSTKVSAVEGSVFCRPVRLPKRNQGFRKKGWTKIMGENKGERGGKYLESLEEERHS